MYGRKTFNGFAGNSWIPHELHTITCSPERDPCSGRSPETDVRIFTRAKRHVIVVDIVGWCLETDLVLVESRTPGIRMRIVNTMIFLHT